VDALVFLLQVEAPVVIEAAAGGEGAELEDGFGTVQSPSGAGDVRLFQQSLGGDRWR
jgi:hypothetical protein